MIAAATRAVDTWSELALTVGIFAGLPGAAFGIASWRGRRRGAR